MCRASDILRAEHHIHDIHTTSFCGYYLLNQISKIQLYDAFRAQLKSMVEQYPAMHALFRICGTGRISDCVWRAEAETMFETVNTNVPLDSGSNLGLPCFEVNPVKMDKVAGAFCGSVRCI